MAEPRIDWYDNTNESIVTEWAIGNIDAGQHSDPFTVLIWNNRGGETDVSDMQDTKITTTDGLGNVMDAVKGQWVECKVDSMGESEFSPIGGDDYYDDDLGQTIRRTKDIAALNQAVGVIKGTQNTGNISDTDNYAKVTLRVFPPLNAPAGEREFKIRVAYFYT